MNPLARLSPALFAALSGLAVAGVPVPVYEQVAPAEAHFYVLLGAPAILSSGGRPGCRVWACEVVVEAVTRFATDRLSGAPADELAEALLLRLDGVALAMPDGWQCMPGHLATADEGPAPVPESGPRVVRRLVLRWEVYCHLPAEPPVLAPVAPPRQTPGFLAAVRGYFQGLF